jgi:hypothetical protein
MRMAYANDKLTQSAELMGPDWKPKHMNQPLAYVNL